MSKELLEIIRDGKENSKIMGIIIGRLANINERGEPEVYFGYNGAKGSFLARSTIKLKKKDIGRETTLMFEGGNYQKPVIIGMIETPERRKIAGHVTTEKEKAIDATIDGERLVLNAKKEIVLRCGKGSITITRAGKVLIRGTYILNRSSGVNRIKGGSVQIN